MKIFLVMIVLFFSACSFKKKPDDWKYKSVSAFSSYTKNFLSSKDVMAKNDLKRAVLHAKLSSNFKPLARIYLGECALNISVGIKDECLKYKDISELVDDEELNSYYAFVTNTLQDYQLDNLASIYKSFVQNSLKNDYKDAISDMHSMDKITSKLVAASLIKDELSFEDVERLLKDISFYGYKKSVIYWLKILKLKSDDIREIKKIDKKIEILES